MGLAKPEKLDPSLHVCSASRAGKFMAFAGLDLFDLLICENVTSFARTNKFRGQL